MNVVLQSVDEYDCTIKKLKRALNILINESQTGFRESFSAFAQHIDLEENITNNVNNGMKKIEFCKTLHSDIRPNLNLIDSITNLIR